MQAGRAPAPPLDLDLGFLPASVADPNRVLIFHKWTVRRFPVLQGFVHRPSSSVASRRIISSRAGSFFRNASTFSISLAFPASVFCSPALR